MSPKTAGAPNMKTNQPEREEPSDMKQMPPNLAKSNLNTHRYACYARKRNPDLAINPYGFTA